MYLDKNLMFFLTLLTPSSTHGASEEEPDIEIKLSDINNFVSGYSSPFKARELKGEVFYF